MYPESSSNQAVLDRRSAAQWDYEVHSIHARHCSMLQEELKKFGRDGWELVCVNMPMGNEYHCVFKKRVA